MDPINEFRSVLERAGIAAEQVIADGRLHRYWIEGDKAGTRNGWYVLHVDGVPAGAYGSWKHGVSGTWRSGGRITPADRLRIEQAKREAGRERERAQQDAETRARWLWDRARPAWVHPYLARKHVKPYCARQMGTLLVLPVQDFNLELHTLQFIDKDGAKKLLRDGRKAGHFISVRLTGASRLLICEGFATGATLADDEPESDVIAAIDAGNLEPVAVEARRRFPALDIVVCCDNDPVGLAKGYAAARAARAQVAVPEVEGADFNDMAVNDGYR